MKRYKSPYLENNKRKSKPDRREDNISTLLKELMPAFRNFLDASAAFQERKAEAELKSAESMLKIGDSLSNLKVQIPELTTRAPRRTRKKHKRSEDAQHRKIKQIILKMRNINETYQAIAAHLESEGIPTFSGRGRWCAQTLHRLYEGYLNQVP